MSKRKRLFVEALLLFLVAVIYTVLVKTIDVSAIGPNHSEVGFSSINKLFHDMFGYNDIFYKMTKYLGIIPFGIVGFYGIQGLLQLIQKKSLMKVDKRLIYLGVFYVLLGCTYVFFEKCIINYRPVILEGELEASYPSSHTMLAICICMSSILISKYYVKNKSYQKIFDICTWILMILLVVGRTLSGVHWISDIMGGVIISSFLVCLFYAFAYTPKITKK